jgi:hypothetical protein
LPCHALPCLAVPCRALPCLAVPCLALPCRAVGWQSPSAWPEPSVCCGHCCAHWLASFAPLAL